MPDYGLDLEFGIFPNPDASRHRELLELAGGTLELRAGEPGGTTLEACLPLDARPPGAAGSPRATTAKTTADTTKAPASAGSPSAVPRSAPGAAPPAQARAAAPRGPTRSPSAAPPARGSARGSPGSPAPSR